MFVCMSDSCRRSQLLLWLRMCCLLAVCSFCCWRSTSLGTTLFPAMPSAVRGHRSSTLIFSGTHLRHGLYLPFSVTFHLRRSSTSASLCRMSNWRIQTDNNNRETNLDFVACSSEQRSWRGPRACDREIAGPIEAATGLWWEREGTHGVLGRTEANRMNV